MVHFFLYDYRFDGIEKGSVVAVSTYMASEHDNRCDQKEWFMAGYYNSMLDVLDLAYMNVNHEKLPSNVLKEWVKLITDELAQISKIKRSDKAR